MQGKDHPQFKLSSSLQQFRPFYKLESIHFSYLRLTLLKKLENNDGEKHASITPKKNKSLFKLNQLISSDIINSRGSNP